MNNVLWLSQLNWHVRKIRFPRNREARPKSWINMSDSSCLPRLASCVFGSTDQVQAVLRNTRDVIHRVSPTLLIYGLRTQLKPIQFNSIYTKISYTTKLNNLSSSKIILQMLFYTTFKHRKITNNKPYNYIASKYAYISMTRYWFDELIPKNINWTAKPQSRDWAWPELPFKAV